MNRPHPEDLSNLSMLELFRVEAENQATVMTSGLLELERGPGVPQCFETLMRAAHSLKGAARIVNQQGAVRVAHAMEDCFVAAQHGGLKLREAEIDLLFKGVDLLADISKRSEANIGAWETDHAAEIDEFLKALKQVMAVGDNAETFSAGCLTLGATAGSPPAVPSKVRDDRSASIVPATETVSVESADRVLRLTAENLNRLLGLASESLVESRWLRPFADSLQRLKRQQADLVQQLDQLRQGLPPDRLSEPLQSGFNELSRRLAEAQRFLADRMLELDTFDRRSAHLSHRLYFEVLRTRMRPFSDGVRHFPRMVRDVARSLGKAVKLEMTGVNTPVDREVLERLEAPLGHLLRNAVDHGCEPPEERARVGKPAQGSIRLDARHSAGTLLITLADDGQGIQADHLRQAIVQRGFATQAAAQRLADSELLQFLFLPGFTLKENITEISGRGVGLDVVQTMVKSLRGTIRIINRPGQGMRFQLQLPITLSVLRALLVEVGGEPYALPLIQITRTLKLPRGSIQTLEGRHHFEFGGQQLGLLTAHQVLECGQPDLSGAHLPVVVLTNRQTGYGLVVDRFLGERELVVQPLEPRLGKVRDVSAAALMEDGSPVLIIDVDDMIRSIEALLADGQLTRVPGGILEAPGKKTKRVLIADDSPTVRELARKLLANRGYLADVATDGNEAWAALRAGQYDMVITDIDMPRMDGIELATLIKKDAHLKSMPVLIISYKDSEAERLRGLEAGADYYLTKGRFHDEALLQAVGDLIGEPGA